MENKPLSEVIGDRNLKGNVIRVEESWSKDVPASVGADAEPIVEPDRWNMIKQAIAARKAGTHIQVEEIPKSIRYPVDKEPAKQLFFVIKGRKLEYLGRKYVDQTSFKIDLSGRFFREWVKLQFPGRKDYEFMVSFSEDTRVGDIANFLKAEE